MYIHTCIYARPCSRSNVDHPGRLLSLTADRSFRPFFAFLYVLFAFRVIRKRRLARFCEKKRKSMFRDDRPLAGLTVPDNAAECKKENSFFSPERSYVLPNSRSIFLFDCTVTDSVTLFHRSVERPIQMKLPLLPDKLLPKIVSRPKYIIFRVPSIN